MTGKIRLMFDAGVLVNSLEKNASRSGIFWASYLVAKELNMRKDVHLSFYCQRNKAVLIRNLSEFNFVPMYPGLSMFDRFYQWIRRKKVVSKTEQKLLRKIFWHYFALFEKIFCWLPNLMIYKLYHTKADKMDYFFSPFLCFPQKIYNNQKIRKYILLYDAIPLLFPDYYPEIKKGNYWLLDVIAQLKSDPSCHAFAISEQTKKDFLKFVPELKPEQITVTPLACSDSFILTQKKKLCVH